MVWLLATVVAAMFQTVRTAMQQHLRDALSPNAAGFVRYSFGAPLALVAVAVIWLAGGALPPLSAGFLWRVALAGLSAALKSVVYLFGPASMRTEAGTYTGESTHALPAES